MFGHLVPCGGGQAVALSKPRLVLRHKRVAGAYPSAPDVELRFLEGWWHVRRIDSGCVLEVNGNPCDACRLNPNDVLTISGKFYRITFQAPESEPPPPVVTPPEEGTDEAPPEEAPVEETPTEEDAIAAALLEAAQTPEDTGGVDENLPEGPKMSASDVEGFRIAVNQCWSVGALSTEALNTTIRLRFEMGQDGKPDPASFELLGFEGGDDLAAQKVFETGRRAVIRCAGPSGYVLPPEKFEDWRVVNIEFDPNGMRLR